MQLVVGLVIIGIAVYAILKRVDVRLALLLAAVALGIVGRDLATVVRQFFLTLTNEQFVVPICCAMGFAYVMRLSACDQHLVHLLVKPMERVRVLLIPGAVLVGFLVNIPVVSQTSTVVTIGAVIVPLLRAGRISPLTIGSALLLGSTNFFQPLRSLPLKSRTAPPLSSAGPRATSPRDASAASIPARIILCRTMWCLRFLCHGLVKSC